MREKLKFTSGLAYQIFYPNDVLVARLDFNQNSNGNLFGLACLVIGENVSFYL